MCCALHAQWLGGIGRGDASSGFQTNSTVSTVYSGGQGRGDAYGRSPIGLGSVMAYSGGIGRGDAASGLDMVVTTLPLYRGGLGRGDGMKAAMLQQDLMLFARAFLEGPFDGDFSMHDSLRIKGLIPLTEPYTALGFALMAGGGGETVEQTVLDWLPNGNVVDWVLLELRHPSNGGEVVATRCALILQNGQVVETDGVSPVTFQDLLPGDYYVAVRHRNHLGVMSGSPISFSPTAPAIIDFTLPYTITYGMDARKYQFPFMLLWAGDANHDGVMKYTGEDNDRDLILQAIGGTVPTAVINGYRPEDVNLDGQVKYTGEANDRDPILVNIGGSVPTNTRNVQLP